MGDGLRPGLLAELGLVGSLHAISDGLGHRSGVDVQLDSELHEEADLPPAVEVAAYRIVGEALTNASRHADASRAIIILRVEGGALSLAVTDDGQGGAKPRAGGTGLDSMRLRAEEVGGTLTITSDSTGTSVSACLPLTVGT